MENNSAKFAFFYMLSLVALVFLALPAGMVIFQFINLHILDSVNRYSYSSSQLRFAISAIIIAAPIYYLTIWQIQKNLVSGLLKKDSGVRRWLTYFILFVASLVMLGWLIAIINSYLNGEVTVKFALKTLTAIIIAAIIAYFYFYDIRRPEIKGKDMTVRSYFYGSLVLVLAVFIVGVVSMGSPAEIRKQRLDNQTLDNFNTIRSAIDTFYRANNALPKDLTELKDQYSYLTDNELQTSADKPIVYKVTGGRAYELCADFATDNRNVKDAIYSYNSQNWPHDAGYQCLPQQAAISDKGLPAPAAP